MNMFPAVRSFWHRLRVPGARWFAYLYLFCATLISGELLLYYPAFTHPHEWQFFLHGMSLSPLATEEGLPASVTAFVNSTRKTTRKERRAEKETRTISTASIFAREKERTLEKQVRNIYVPYNNVARYPAINYIPHMIAGAVGSVMELPPAKIYYLTRFLSLLPAVIGGFFILLLLPAYHLPAFVFMMLPSIWMLRLNQPPDNLLNLAAMAYAALIIRNAYTGARVRAGYMAGYVVSGILLSVTKLVYFPLTLALLILPGRCFRSAGNRWACIGLVTGICAVASIFSTLQAFRSNYAADLDAIVYHSIQGDDVAEPVQSKKQRRRQPSAQSGRGTHVNSLPQQNAARHFLAHPSEVIGKMIHTYVNPDFWFAGMRNLIIWRKGMPHAYRPYERWMYLILLLPFFLVPVRPPVPLTDSGKAWPGFVSRIWLIGLCAAGATSVALALYLNHPPGNSPALKGLQGRYYMPMLPFLMLALAFRMRPAWCLVWQGLLLPSCCVLMYIFYRHVF